jgi:hypothetical protein
MSEKEPFQDAVRRGAVGVCARWPKTSGPVLLIEAHRLLDDSDIERAVINAAMDWAYHWDGRIGFVRGDDGRCVVPFPEKILPFLQAEVWTALRDGRLIARSIDPGNAVRGKLAVIPAVRWHLIEPVFERSSAVVEGKTVAIGIMVEAVASRAINDKLSPVSDATLFEWIKKYKKEQARTSSQESTWEAAKNVFGPRVTRERVLAACKALVPEWDRPPGRPRKNPPR